MTLLKHLLQKHNVRIKREVRNILMTLLDGSQVSHCCPLGYLFYNYSIPTTVLAPGHLSVADKTNLFKSLQVVDSNKPAKLHQQAKGLKVWTLKEEINRIYDGVEAETRKSQASFQIFQV